MTIDDEQLRRLSVADTGCYQVSDDDLEGIHQRLTEWAQVLLAGDSGGPAS